MIKLKHIFCLILILTSLFVGIYTIRSNTENKDFSKIIGSWVRPDGGYILDLKSVNSSGIIDASYFNPDPINVAEAKAIFQSNTITLFIKLKDIGYPGSYYLLTYNPDSDKLIGVYYHMILKKNFKIYFTRK